MGHEVMLSVEDSLARALDAVKPVEEPQAQRDGRIKNHLTDFDVQWLILVLVLRNGWVWGTVRGVVPSAWSVERSYCCHGETAICDG